MARATKPANSPSNASALGVEANYAWVQQFIHYLAPSGVWPGSSSPTAACIPTNPAKAGLAGLR